MSMMKKTVTKTELSQAVLARMNEVLKRKNITQAQLVKKFQEAGYSILQSDVSKVLSGRAKVSVYFLTAFSEVTEVSLDGLVSGDQRPAAPLRIGEKNFQIDPDKDDGFLNILGEYFVYFPTTNRAEKNELVSGKLVFRSKKGFCEAAMLLDHVGSERKLEKNYRGQLILSRKMHAGYVFLYNGNYGEISVFMFRYRDFITRQMECRLAMAVTMSAGETKKPTAHRILLSRRQLDKRGQDAVAAYLTMNNADIWIEEQTLSQYIPEDFSQKELLDAIVEEVKNKHYFLINESDIRKAKRKISQRQLMQIRRLLDEISEGQPENVQISESDDSEVFILLEEVNQE